jgi:hypothetical protein
MGGVCTGLGRWRGYVVRGWGVYTVDAILKRGERIECCRCRCASIVQKRGGRVGSSSCSIAAIL